MIIQNSEQEYKGYVIGLCSGKDYDGAFFEGYYRFKDAEKHEETYTENNWWQTKTEAYAGIKAEIDDLDNIPDRCRICGGEDNEHRQPNCYGG